ncbi:hypothetical protein I203_106347 [Kwoniella mangroviensis CBS 8507]|uniref:uncharacterized protein n=1 Tax=Kwoniella mangroviensis CBS 8507 TaxID=1296122 RepID=UPI00080CFD0B|nr:uncharacterized protein I203_07624 [Kwoniella mangroviensis CBS 8507]OCF63200.1 hypothetical protein I203_07624 [Kwoniella mangroviensis CBS 8507]
MTQVKPKSAVIPQPSTPSGQSTSTMTSSPPLSPSSSHPHASDDELTSDLSESWMEVDERSSVGLSVLGDVVFSDTSSDSHGLEHETRSQWSASSDGGRDGDVEDGGAVILEPTHDDEIGSPSLTGYTDAEASTCKLDSSRETLHTSSDQIRLIYPDGASFTTSSSGTLSGGFTPSASISALTPMAQPDQGRRPRAGTSIVQPTISPIVALGSMSPRRSSSPVRRGVEDSWLKSSKLWTPPTDSPNISLEDRSKYQLLQSNDDIKETDEDDKASQAVEDLEMPKLTIGNEEVGDETLTGTRIQSFLKDLDENISEKSFPSEAAEAAESVRDDIVDDMETQQVLAADNIEAIKTIAKKWSTRVSYFALASILSVALIRTFGSNMFVPFVPDYKDSATDIGTTSMPLETPKSSSFWGHLSFASHASTSSASSASTPTTAAQPDPRLIEQALSTLSSIHVRLSSAAIIKPTADTGYQKTDKDDKARRNNARSSTSCCSLSVRDNNVALTVPPAAHPPDSRVSLARKFTQKLLRVNKTDGPDMNTTSTSSAPVVDCSCSLSTIVQSQILERIIRPAKAYALTTSRYIDAVLGPILHSTGRLLGSGLYATNQALHQASRGANALKNRIKHFFTSHSPSSKEESLARASAMFDSLSEYVETRLDALSDSLDEQADIMHEKSMDCIIKAKKGLDRFISDYKAYRGAEGDGQPKIKSTDVEKDGPLPFTHMDSSCQLAKGGEGCKKTRRGQARHEKRMLKQEWRLRGKKVNMNIPPMEKLSRGKKFMDMLHHGAMALVL